MSTMTITSMFNELFYGGAGTSVDVPYPYDVALNGTPYMLDDAHPAFKEGMQTIALLRSQADTGTLPGEGSTNPEGLWPRPAASWHKGSGQRYFDRGDSDASRFWRSYGIDCWTYGKLSTLPRGDVLVSSANTNLHMCTAGDYLYFANGTEIYWRLASEVYFGSGVASTASLIQNGESAQAVKDLTSDGYTVWAALGTNGIHSTVRGTGVSSHYNALDCELLVYVKDRLMAAKDRILYNVTSGSAPDYSFTHPSIDWNWVDFTAGNSSIYAAGYAGDKSSIYRIPIRDDGTGLDTPLVAGSLPDGEVVTAICGYLGFVAIGTTKGFRLAIENDDGSLTLGALVDLGRAVTAFEPQDRFIFFTWSDFGEVDTKTETGFAAGMGRMDLSVFSDVGGRIPAYASDVMVVLTSQALTQNVIRDIVTINNAQHFSLSTVGICCGNGPKVNGWIESGLIGYGNPDEKVALRLPMQHEALPVSAYIDAWISDDDRVFQFIGSSSDEASTAPDQEFVIGQTTAKQFELKLELSNAVLERYDLGAYPTASRGKEILVPLRLHEEMEDANGNLFTLNPLTEYQRLEALSEAERLVSYQELTAGTSVFVSEVKFERHSPTKKRTWWNGTAVCRLKVLGG